MTLQQKIQGEIKGAMLAKDKVRLNVLRGLVTAFVNEVIAQKRKPQDDLADEDALNVIRRGVKQRKDSIEQFKAGGRADLVASEEAELTILQTFLPATMNKDDIRAVAEKKRIELGVTDKSKLGIFMGAVMKELKGKADGADVKEVVEAMFV